MTLINNKVFAVEYNCWFYFVSQAVLHFICNDASTALGHVLIWRCEDNRTESHFMLLKKDSIIWTLYNHVTKRKEKRYFLSMYISQFFYKLVSLAKGATNQCLTSPVGLSKITLSHEPLAKGLFACIVLDISTNGQ